MLIIILQHLQQKLDQHLRDEQHGFRPGRSYADLIFPLKMLVEDSKEWNKKPCLLFVDLEKALDSVDREMLWKILKYYGIFPKIVELIITVYKETECCVRTENGVTRYFKIMTGVKQ